MSRWHKSSCKTPDVVVEDGVPCCLSCHKSPNIERFIIEEKKSSPPWAVSPDEKFGELNLHWPESVPYRPYTSRARPRQSLEASESHGVYDKSLDSSYFRLLCLSAPKNDGNPIHAVLETHPVDDCPEYETVSYCWGGENNDTERRNPVYIGDWWDVLLQTNNCNAMLLYLRPRRGARVVWVDAICINQNDHVEREAQVTLMGSIYQNCSRAVVYLGNDAAQPAAVETTGKRSYPARYELQDYERQLPGSEVRFRQLLELRYFQRVWVIQEVIRAPSIILPVEGMEFTVGQLTASRLEDQLHWSSTGAPWLQHMCTGRVESSRTLQQLLEQTRHSKATDPRDKVFALLGFMPSTQVLTPDYSASSLHVYIGTIAHLLLNEHCVKILAESRGYRAHSAAPSWLPEWTIHDMGEQIFQLSESDESNECKFTRERFPPGGIISDYLDKTLGPEANHWLPPVSVREHSLGSGAMDPTVWDAQKVSVHATTYALSIPLVYLCEITSNPVEIFRFNRDCGTDDMRHILPDRIFEIAMPEWKLFLHTADIPLNEIIEPEPTSVFLLADAQRNDVILFMKYIGPGSAFRLIKCCYCYNLSYVARDLPALDTKRFRIQMLDPPDNYQPDVWPAWEQALWQTKVYNSYETSTTVYDLLSHLIERLKAFRSYTWAMLEEIRSHADVQGEQLNLHTAESYLLEMFQRLVTFPESRNRKREFNPGEEILTHSFFDCYVKFMIHCYPQHSALLRGYDPVLKRDDDYYVLIPENPPETWFKVYGALFGWYVGAHNSRAGLTDKLSSCTLHQLSNFRYLPVEDLATQLRASMYFSVFERLNYCSQLTKEDILSLATKMPPKAEYKSIIYHEWPEGFHEGDKVPGRIEHVTIV